MSELAYTLLLALPTIAGFAIASALVKLVGRSILEAFGFRTIQPRTNTFNSKNTFTKVSWALKAAAYISSNLFWGVFLGVGYTVVLWAHYEQPNIQLASLIAIFVGMAHIPFYQVYKSNNWDGNVLVEVVVLVTLGYAMRDLQPLYLISALMAALIVIDVGFSILYAFVVDDAEDKPKLNQAVTPALTETSAEIPTP